MLTYFYQSAMKQLIRLFPNHLIPITSLLILACASPQKGLAFSFDEIQEKGEISIAVYRDFPPFSYKEKGKLKGVDVDIAKHIAKSLNVRLNLIEQTADENVDDDLRNAIWKGHYLGGQVADIMLHVPYDSLLAKRNDLVVLFGPYYREDMVLARDIKKVGKDATLAVYRFENIGVELDSLADMYLSGAFGGSIREKLLHYTTTYEAAADMIKGKTFGLMGPRSIVEGAIGSHKKAYQIGKVPTPGLSKDNWLIGAAVKNTYRQLGYAVGDILGEMVTSGQIKDIFKAHGLSYSPPPASFYN
ncbi:substrate-binding periplasmic protein [Candidatus Terasakiella magnetica]|uniref:substrate-binding periplasmic protein n=1 Tax=Candidatus Terasakiella magnetica TaxID=1867952 RepID=UPI00196A1C01|nr:transporter substrate-binding domain-containing protein [Candidatus Terasakiella magnetica]